MSPGVGLSARASMLFESIKKRIVNGLINEILALEPLHLELVGHGLIELLENKTLIHHGINKDYKFVGYTVDSFSDDSLVIAQYSTEAGYFDNTGTQEKPAFKKIEKDTDSAEAHRAPTAKTKIYLLSSQEEKPSFRASFNKTEIAQRLGESLIVLDARELAKRIYDTSVEKPEAAAFFRAFFPEFAHALDNFEYYGRLPAQCENHQSDEGVLAAIRGHFSAGNTVAVLHGLSGSGKTQAAIDFVHKEAAQFENYIWLASGDWNPDIPLTAVTRARGGGPINVVGSFNSTKSILVIDKLDRAVDPAVFFELEAGFKRGGVVLVTSQVAAPGAPTHVPMPQLQRDVAIRILGEDPTKASDTCERFVEACKFLPLVLATARTVVEAQGIPRDAFYTEVLAAPDALSRNDGVSILRSILGKLDGAPRAALERIANTGLHIHDGAFLGYYIGHIPRTELQKLALLSPASAPGVLFVHDLVCEVMQTADEVGSLVAALEGYIEQSQGEMSPSILRQIHLCQMQLLTEHDRRGTRDPDWLVYALLQVEGGRSVVSAAYAGCAIDPAGRLAALMCVIDAREQHGYLIASADERHAYYTRCAQEYGDAVLAAKGRNRAELLHHLGKALRRTGEIDSALHTFQQLLKLEPSWHATHGQVAHLGAQHDATEQAKQAGEQSLRFLVAQMIKDPMSVPLRVSMAALANLRSYKEYVDELSTSEDMVHGLAQVISLSALEGLDQFYDAFLAFTSKFGYRHPRSCLELVRAIVDMFLVSPDSIGWRHLLSASESLANAAQSAGRAGEASLAQRLSKLSCVYADALLASQTVDGYSARGLAKVFIIADMPQRALDVISAVPAEQVNHWLLYRMAEGQMALKLPEAPQTAREALSDAIGDPRAKRQLAAYYDLLSRCLEQAGDVPGAIEQAQSALDCSQDELYRSELEARLQILKHRYPQKG